MPLARLNIPSVFLSGQRDEGATTEDGMKSPLRASCSDKRRTGFPASLSVARPSYTFLMRAVVLPQLSGKSRNQPGTFGGSYSVLMIPTFAPQCPHFIYKSGYRPLWGILVCVFVPFTASSSFHPHFGQYTGRILSLMSFCSTSFLPWRKPVTPFRQSQSGCRGAGLQSVRSYSSTMSVSQCATGLERSRALRYAISKVRQVFPK